MGALKKTKQTKALEFSRRSKPRKSFQRGVGVLIRGEYQVGIGYEIGENGMSVEILTSPSVGTLVVLSFQIPHGLFVSIQSEVRNCVEIPGKGARIGCLFREIKFERRREIRAFVSSRGKEPNFGNQYYG